MSKKTKDLPLRVIKPPLDVALDELKKQEEDKATVVQRTTVGEKTTVIPDHEEKDKRTTASKRTTVVKKTTVGEKTIITFVPYEEVFAEDDPNYWFKYVVTLHWLMDNLYPHMKSSTATIYARLLRLAYGIKSNKGVCKVGYRALERSSGVTKKHVKGAIKEIKQMGAVRILEIENKGKQGGGST